MCQIIFSSSYKLSTLFLGKYTLPFGLYISDSLAEKETGFFELYRPQSKCYKKSDRKLLEQPCKD